MTRQHIGQLVPVAAIVFTIVACDQPRVTSAGEGVGVTPQFSSLDRSEWSAPVNLGPVINTAASEANAALSPDGLSLYFVSDRPGSLGSTDIWVSHRECEDCPWGVPFNIGAPVNTVGLEAGPRLSNDGHLLFIQSDRPGGLGLNDIYVSRRANPKDDFGWGTPVNLGAGVNSSDDDQAPQYLQSAEDGAGNLYFNRGTLNSQDIYVAGITRDGEVREAAVAVAELNILGTREFHPTIRNDGREIFFASNRPGGLGNNDIWTSTRQNVHEPWSPPTNVGAPVNSAATEVQPSLSKDGRTLIITSIRPGGFGGNDLYISTRSPGGH